MGLWKRGRFGTPVRVVEQHPPADIVDTPEATRLELEARQWYAVELIDEALAAHRGEGGCTELINLCLDLRSALAPTPVDAQVPGVRPPVPVNPGRWP